MGKRGWLRNIRDGRRRSSHGDTGMVILWIIGAAIAFALMLAILNQLLFGPPAKAVPDSNGSFQTWEQVEVANRTASAMDIAVGGDASPINDPSAPTVSARSAVVMDLVSGRVVYDKRGSEKAYPASTTKIMTALLGIEYGQMDRMVTVSDTAVGVEGSSIYLVKDEEISMEDLLYGAMLRSGNDAATAIAAEVGTTLISADGGNENDVEVDPVELFVDLMNRRAVELGAVNTHFMNPTGLHDENHYTTAYDMALMGRAAMMNPAFAKIAGTERWTAKRQDGRDPYFYNKNKVVQQYDGGTGVKIGYTKASGRTLVASSEKDGRKLICVVMDAPDWFNDAYKLMDHVYEQYELMTVAEGGLTLERIPVEGGARDTVWVGVSEDVTCLIRPQERENVAVAYAVTRPVKAPVSRGQTAGQLHVYVTGQYLYSVPLYFLEDVDEGKR